MTYYKMNADTDNLRVTEVNFTQTSDNDFRFINMRPQDSPIQFEQDLKPLPLTNDSSYLIVCPYGKYPDLFPKSL